MTTMLAFQTLALALALYLTAVCITAIVQMLYLVIYHTENKTTSRVKGSFNFTPAIVMWVVFFVLTHWQAA